MPLLGALVLVAFVVVVVHLSSRHNELFLIAVRAGQLKVVRGQVSARLLADFREVIRLAGLRQARLRAVILKGEACLQAPGVDEPLAQRLRNVFFLHHR